jgi:hypothetical protein
LESAPHVLLAMQKVEGSNPFSRFRKGLRLQVFFVSGVGLVVRDGIRWGTPRPMRCGKAGLFRRAGGE